MNRRTVLILGVPAVAGMWVVPASAADASGQRFPDVLAVKVRAVAGNRFDFDVTVSSPYDTAQRYADGFRVTSADDRVFGERKLLHDHADEQPFTRDLHGGSIPPDVSTVVAQVRDQAFGYGGKSASVALPGR